MLPPDRRSPQCSVLDPVGLFRTSGEFVRVLLQRVSRAEVEVEGETVGRIGRGLLVFVGIGPSDGDAELRWMAQKVARLRVFADDAGKMNRSVVDVEGGVLVVSQFTLYGDCRKGTRPSFSGAGAPEVAARQVGDFCERLRDEGVSPVATGRFGAHMRVDLLNDGPVTLWIEREPDRTRGEEG